MGNLRATFRDMRRRPRPLWAALVGVVLSFGATAPLAAQTSPLRHEPGPIELEIPIFDGGYGVAFYAETARQFESAHPDVRVNIHGDPRMHDKMRIRVIDGNLPDATFSDLSWLNLIRAGRALDLTSFLDGPSWDDPNVRWRDTFLPGALEAWTIDGHTYGLPFAQSCWTIFYDRKLFRAHGWSPPRTWDEFFALGEKMKTAGVAPLALPGVYLRYGDTFLRAAYYNLVGLEGWRAYNNLEPGMRTDPRFVRAARIFQRVAREDLVAGWEGMTHTSAQLALLQGRAAMVVSGSWMLHEMEGKIPEGFEIGAMNFPVFADGITDASTLQGSSEFFFVFAKADAARERLVVDFLRYLTSRERAASFVRTLDSPVALRGVPAEAFSPVMRDTARMFEQARGMFSAPPNMLLAPGMEQALNDARYELAKGNITPEQFGAHLESAAAAARARAASPTEVTVRHPIAGVAMLATLAASSGWIAFALWRRLRAGRPAAGAGGEGVELRNAWFGPLRGRLALWFVAPAFVLFAAIILVPGIGSFVWSLTNWDAMNPRSWTGLFNFRWLLFESEVFWAALQNNLFLMIAPAAIVVPLSLFFAALIHRGVAGAKLFRACFLFPNILGGVAATLIWMNTFDPRGLVNSTLVGFGHGAAWFGDWWFARWLAGFENFAWLGQGMLYWSLVPIYVWLMVGFNLVLYLAAMESIDPQYYEAAELDGAGPFAQFFRVTLPMIREVVATSVVFIVVAGLNTFEMVWLLTSQNPTTKTHVLSTWMVSTMFKEFEIGRATAIAVMMFLIVAGGSGVALLTLRRNAAET